LKLAVHFTDEYPDALPQLSLQVIEGSLDDGERHSLLQDLQQVAEANLGMAMTFTLVSHLNMERERIALKEEEARTRGTVVTAESFRAWKVKFDHEQAMKKAREEDEKMKGMTPKEREEWKRAGARLSGRQLFERNKILEEDTLMEEGTVSVDASQYERTRTAEDEEEDTRITFSDSD